MESFLISENYEKRSLSEIIGFLTSKLNDGYDTISINETGCEGIGTKIILYKSNEK